MSDSNKLDHESSNSETVNGEQISARSTLLILLAIVIVIAIIVGAVMAIIAMVNHPESTENIRDIVIVFMAAEFLFIGFVLILLVIQLARLTALIRHEVRPILEATNQTMGTIRGTTTFLSDNLVSPVIKANSTIAAVKRAAEILAFWRRN